MINIFFTRYKKYLIRIVFIITFITVTIINLPTWIMAHIINQATAGKIQLYNADGTLWNGRGLLVVYDTQLQHSSPLVFVGWKVTLGIDKLVDVKLSIGDTPIADIYISHNQLNIDKVNLSLSVVQFAPLIPYINNFILFGDINIQTPHIILGKTSSGMIMVTAQNMSSGLSHANPCGNYTIQLDLSTSNIVVSSSPDSILKLTGTGTLQSLFINGSIQEQHIKDLQQLVTLLGRPTGPNQYSIKVF